MHSLITSQHTIYLWNLFKYPFIFFQSIPVWKKSRCLIQQKIHAKNQKKLMNSYREKLWIDRWTDHFTGPSIYDPPFTGVQYNNSIKPKFLRTDATKRIKQNKNNENHLPPVNLHQLMKLTSRRSNAIAHRKNLSHMQYL